MELVNGHESFLALSSRGSLSVFDASFKFARASHMVSGEPWSTVRAEQIAFGEEWWGGTFYVSSAVIGVCAGLMSASVRMRRKIASRSRFVKDVVSWLRRLGVSQSGQGSRETPGPSVPGRVRSAPSVWMLFWECSSSDEDVMFPEVSVHLLDPWERRLAAYGGFVREENIIFLEARSILFAQTFR